MITLLHLGILQGHNGGHKYECLAYIGKSSDLEPYIYDSHCKNFYSFQKIYSIADKIVAGKRKKMLQEEKELKKQKIASSDKEKHADDDQSGRDNLDRETIINQEIANIKPISR